MGVSKCLEAPTLSAATTRRLLSDLKKLHEEPVHLAAAAPCSEKDLSLWNGVIGVDLNVTGIGEINVPLHFLIDFPAGYPQEAPNIGFSFDFVYRNGAEITMSEGRLKGKKAICLDILGNFGDIHTEWSKSVGSGWTPAYTVSTLLVQLQSMLSDIGASQSQSERDDTYHSAQSFAEAHPEAMLPLLSEAEIRASRHTRDQASRLLRICGSDESLAERIRNFAESVKLTDGSESMETFMELLSAVASKSGGGTSAASASGSKPPAKKELEVDTNICCFSTGKLYTEATLGVGLSRAKQNLATAGELLSKGAYEGGLRQNTNKSEFEFFLPVWINKKHAADNKVWCGAVKANLEHIGKAVYGTTNMEQAAYEVFPRLINQLIVEMMRPDAPKSEAIATFEAMVNFWRTFRWALETLAALRERVKKLLVDFTREEAKRTKDAAPDLGAILVMFTAYQGLPGCPNRSDFMNAYADENSLRWVMWWQRSGTPAKSAPVFEATKVSRDIAMFQAMVMDIIVGNVPTTLVAMEATNCKLPERLELLQKEWRQRKSTTSDWVQYFKNIGAAAPTKPIDLWIEESVTRAAIRGPKYGGAKGSGAGGKGGGYSGGAKGSQKGGGKGAWSQKGKGW